MDGGKFKRKLSEFNTRAVSRGQNELVGKFKMAAGDMVSIRGPFILVDRLFLSRPHRRNHTGCR